MKRGDKASKPAPAETVTEITPKRGPGRPASGKAFTAAERAARYRANVLAKRLAKIETPEHMAAMYREELSRVGGTLQERLDVIAELNRRLSTIAVERQRLEDENNALRKLLGELGVDLSRVPLAMDK